MADKPRLVINIGAQVSRKGYYNEVEEVIDVPLESSAVKVAALVADLIPKVREAYDEYLMEQAEKEESK